jgi:hypothetical protein
MKAQKWIIAIGIVMTTVFMHAQRYDVVGGIRLGNDLGLSAAVRIADKFSIDGTAEFGLFTDHQFYTLMGKRHWSILGSKRFNLYGGAGVFSRIPELEYEGRTIGKAYGLSFVGGAELTVGRLTFAVDAMPMFTANNDQYNKRYYANGGVSVRYVFDTRPTKANKTMDKIKDRLKIKKKSR